MYNILLFLFNIYLKNHFLVLTTKNSLFYRDENKKL